MVLPEPEPEPVVYQPPPPLVPEPVENNRELWWLIALIIGLALVTAAVILI